MLIDKHIENGAIPVDGQPCIQFWTHVWCTPRLVPPVAKGMLAILKSWKLGPIAVYWLCKCPAATLSRGNYSLPTKIPFAPLRQANRLSLDTPQEKKVSILLIRQNTGGTDPIFFLSYFYYFFPSFYLAFIIFFFCVFFFHFVLFINNYLL